MGSFDRSADRLLQLLQTAQSGVVIHLVNLGLGASQKDVPLTQLQRLGKVSCW